MTSTVDPTTDEGTGESELGRARRRKEDEHLITGRTRWTDNIVLPGMLHAAILREEPARQETMAAHDAATDPRSAPV